jgi:hypothetical protein
MPVKCLAAAAFLISAPAFAQLDQSRFEVPLFGAEEIQPSVISLGTDGLLLYRRFTAFRDTDQLEVTRLDTAFQPVWSGFVDIDNNLSLVDTDASERRVHILLRNRIMAYASFQIISLEKESGRFQVYTVSSQIPMVPVEFRVTQRAALIAGYFNQRPLVLYFDLTARRAKILPGFFNTAGEITQLEVDDRGFIELIFSMRMVDRKKELWVRTYDPEGNLIRNNVLRAEDRHNLIFGRSVVTADGRKVVAGVYGNRFSEYSRGVFVARLDEEGESTIRYYNYSELKYFFNYMKAGRQQRIRDRIERKKVRGKEIKFNYRLLVHELVPHDGKYLLLGEAFYPKYRYYYGSAGNSPYRSPLLFGMPLARSEPVFDGFQYTHAVVLAIRPDGQLAWDNSFEINGIRTFELDQFVKLQIRGSQVALLYTYGNEIRGKIVDENEVKEARTFDPILLKFRDDKVPPNGTEVSRLDYWFGQTLFASGVQRVQNLRDSDVLTNRRVFFINKIRYR